MDIWSTVSTPPGPAAPTPPAPVKDWGYDDGWDGPAPNLSAPDQFPALGGSRKPPAKRAKETPKAQGKPADFSSLLGSKSAEIRSRERVNSGQEGMSWIQSSIAKNKAKTQNPWSAGATNTGSSTGSRLGSVSKPAPSFSDLLKNKSNSPSSTVPKPAPTNSLRDELSTNPYLSNFNKLHSPSNGYDSQEGTSPEYQAKSKLRNLAKPTQSLQALLSAAPSGAHAARSAAPSGAHAATKSTGTAGAAKLSPVSVGNKLGNLDDVPGININTFIEEAYFHSNVSENVRTDNVEKDKTIFESLKSQMKKLSSRGKPLIYLIQNGLVVVRLAET